MKTKLRRFVSILSAMLLMICCAVPAFADDTDSIFTEHIFSKLENTYPHSEYSYMVISYNPTNSPFTFFQCFVVSQSSKIFYNSSDRTVSTDGTFIDSFVHRFSDNSCGREVRYGNRVYVDIKDFNIIYSDLPVYEGDAPIYTDPNAPPVPFTVDYSPSLKTGLVRKGTLVAPGASNDGQEVETNTIAVTVKLTDAFLNASKPISGAYTYSYQFTCFVVPSEYKDSDIKTMSEHAIYTAAQDNLHYLYYENETLDVDDSLSSEPATGPDIVPVSEQWANATGVSNCFLLERDNNNTPLRNVTIDLHNIDFEKHKSDSYNIVVLGHIVRKSEYGWTAYPSYFKSDCSSLALESTKEYPMNFGSSEQPVINKNFYDYYSVISDDWSFKDYPKFEPHKVGGVTVGDSPLDFKRTAKGVQDYNMWEQGGTDNTLKPDDFDKYKEQKKLDENFGSVDFGLDSIKSVFDGSSDFFKFLTASIGILPTTFLTILISFFVVMLAICVVKWVLK